MVWPAHWRWKPVLPTVFSSSNNVIAHVIRPSPTITNISRSKSNLTCHIDESSNNVIGHVIIPSPTVTTAREIKSNLTCHVHESVLQSSRQTHTANLLPCTNTTTLLCQKLPYTNRATPQLYCVKSYCV